MATVSRQEFNALLGNKEDEPVVSAPTVTPGTVSQAQQRAMLLRPSYDPNDPTKPIGAWSIGPGGIPRGWAKRTGEIFGEGLEITGKLTGYEGLERFGGKVIDTFREAYGYRPDPNRSWETAKKEIAGGNPFPMLMFMWETSPESVAYLPYVVNNKLRMFAVASETNRIAKQRGQNDGRAEHDLKVSDYAYAFPSAVVNITGEYIPGITPIRRA